MKTFLKDSGHLTFKEIQLYLSGKMNSEKRFKVENHLLSCSLCENAVEGFKNSKNIGEDLQALEKLRNKIIPNTKKKTAIMWPLKVAASLIFVLIPLAVLYLYHPEDIPEKYAAHLSEEFAAGSRWITKKTTFQKALDAGENEDYIICISYLKDTLQGNPSSSGLNYYMGLAHYGNQDFKKAIQYLNTVEENSSYYEDAYWYSILSLIKRDEISEAINMLNQYTIKEPNGFYVDEAEKLKRILE